MPIGSRLSGTATGPAVAPRDPSQGSYSGYGAGPSGMTPGGPAAGGGGLAIVRYDDAVGQSQEGAPALPAGTIEVTFQPADGVGFIVLIDRIVVQTNSTTPTAVAFYRDSVADQNLVEFSGTGDKDLADEFNPIYLPATSKLIARWTGASAAASATVRYQFRVAHL